MSDKINITIKKSGVSYDVEFPDIRMAELEKFPYSEVFLRIIYKSYVRNMLHGLPETELINHPYHSLESVIERALHIKKSDIDNWMDSKCWSATDLKDKSDEGIKKLKELLWERRNQSREIKGRLADLVASVSERNDLIGDILFSGLTLDRPHDVITAQDL
ncbi:hypothetical protein ACFQH5_01890 [Halomonas salifodinae]|uniref:Uncharacterized protein n=1 Tax=Halomonas salifodinae TaxID=438745 RepID=A0ABW2EW90_9GAMM